MPKSAGGSAKQRLEPRPALQQRASLYYANLRKPRDGSITLLLQIKGVSRNFGGLVALKQVSLNVARGEIFGLIGPNGAGKTTLLNVIAGVCPPDSGTLLLDDEDITGLKSDALCKKGLSRTFQISQSFPRLTAAENVLVAVTFGTNISRRDKAEKRVRELLDLVGFPLPVDSLAADLNTSQLKRLDLARALGSAPKLLLLDEFAAGLTPTEIFDLTRLLRAIRDSGVTLVLVEHLMRVITQVCDRVAFLQSGEKIVEGTPKQIIEDARVTNAYLGDEGSGRGEGDS